MFRARWLVHASDLPADVLSRLRTTRQVAESDRGATGSKKPVAKDQDGADEVFLTNRVEDVEVRSVVKPITLCVSSSGTTAVSPERNHKMGPRLTHAYFAASGDFRPLESTDPLLKRARVRQANAVALAFRADQEHEAAKSGKPIVKSNGWLLPKRRAFERRGAQTAARGGGGDVEIAAPSLECAGSHEISTSPIVDIEDESDDCGTDAPSNPEDGEWKEGDDKDASDSNSDRPKKSQPTLSGDESFTKRKSPRQRKSQLSPAPDAKADNCSEANPEANTTTPNFQRRRRVPFKKRQVPLPPRPRRLAIPTMAEEPVIAHVCKASPPASAEFSMVAKAVRPVRTRISIGLEPQSSVPLPRSSSMEDVGKASPRQYISTKRKRSVPSEATKGANRSHHPPLRTLVGKDRQTDIPDLLSAAERKRPHTGTGAKMVWRSVQDWDPQSRAMLDNYLHAAKGVVEAKQARPGVAVHVRLSDKKGRSDVDKDNNTDVAGSYAVWAISCGREARGLIRVGCSEVAQTDIARSAIQSVQSQEQALSALVKTRCVLDNFEPALEMLAGDQGLPGSIEPWTLKQVRTLEKALVKEYDPNRRLHGWARPGTEMDRGDFIDLAKISEEVPGKTPAQVLSFYHRYLAAAEPLTDVVYGPEAAEARKQEPISPVSSAPELDAIIPSNGRSSRGSVSTTNPEIPARQVSPELWKVSATNSSDKAIETAPKPKPRTIRLSPPKPVKLAVANTESNAGTTVGSVPNDAAPTKKVPSPPACDAVCSTAEAISSPHSPAVYNHATNGAAPGGDERPARTDRGSGRKLAEAHRVTGRSADRQGGRGGGLNGVSEYLDQQRRCAVRERQVTRTLPVLPSDPEVLEVEDSDDADEGGASRNSEVLAAGPSDVEAATGYINSMGSAGLSCGPRQLRQQEAPTVAPDSRPSGMLPIAPRSAPRDIDRKGGQRAGGSDDRGDGRRSEAPSFPSARGEPMWEQPPLPHPIRHEKQLERLRDRPTSCQVERGDIPSSRGSSPGYPDRRNVHEEPKPSSIDDTFGPMAPCWRLLERAQGYMEKDQLEYMKGLILTHVRKPMSRDQLLERAESCLQEQDRIFAAFVKMFDHIDQPPQVPLYPTRRATHPRPCWTPYRAGRSPEASPIHASPHALSVGQIPPQGAFNVQQGGFYSTHPTNDTGESGSTVSTSYQPYPPVGIPVSRRVEARRSIHPYGHHGAGRWRASGVGSIGRNDDLGIRVEPPAHRPSPGQQPSDVRLHRAGYPERLADSGHEKGRAARNAWLQQSEGEWGSSIAKGVLMASGSPRDMTRRSSRGPAWGSRGGGTWS